MNVETLRSKILDPDTLRNALFLNNFPFRHFNIHFTKMYLKMETFVEGNLEQ